MNAAAGPYLLPLASAALAFVLALAWRGWALRRGVVDLPDARRLHVQPTPRGGGIGIAVVLLCAAPWLGPAGPAFAAGLALCAGAGLVDDLRPLRPALKFLLQALGTGCLAWALPLLPGWLDPPAGFALAWVGALALVNAWNFMDGSNGLATTQAALAAGVLALLAPAASPAALLGAVLVAACLGFLPLNFPRARVFLGDVGSHALGYAVAALLLLVAPAAADAAWVLLLPVSAIALDAGLTLASRAARRQVLWRAHREHLYQRAVGQGWSHAGICALYAAWTALAGVLALWLATRPAPWPALGSTALLGFGIIAYFLMGRAWPRHA